jgi:hypothetical protein
MGALIERTILVLASLMFLMLALTAFTVTPA